jgi:endogenous inhibitor of DNA gyrase (YacG/DUF329 family)
MRAYAARMARTPCPHCDKHVPQNDNQVRRTCASCGAPLLFVNDVTAGHWHWVIDPGKSEAWEAEGS